VLCLNRRNAGYILPGNPRSNYHRVDEKLVTKTLAAAAGVRCPETYAVITCWGDINRTIRKTLSSCDTCVIKPNRGVSGRGILILEKKDLLVNGRMQLQDVRYHVSSILSGLYSLSELPDKAFIEQRIFPHPLLASLTWKGTPDIRVILYKSIPVIAMMRLPTRRSAGRANIHQGAVGTGISLSNGKTVAAIYRNRMITRHPDTGAHLAGLEIPGWHSLLESAQNLSHQIPLAYIGIDFMLDEQDGHLVVEANARPGLSIQLANAAGLRKRLEYIDTALARDISPEEITRHVSRQANKNLLR
jgi:alpha-L-glutamate ligase-like protein